MPRSFLITRSNKEEPMKRKKFRVGKNGDVVTDKAPNESRLSRGKIPSSKEKKTSVFSKVKTETRDKSRRPADPLPNATEGALPLVKLNLPLAPVPCVLREVVRADHDYLELLVKVKDEQEDFAATNPQDVEEREADYDDDDDDEPLFNLSQLAEVSLAAEGRLNTAVDSGMARKIREARMKQLLESSRLNAMQLLLPENASHMIVCSSSSNNNNNKIRRRSKSQQEQQELMSSSPSSSYHCGDCGKRYSTSSNLARHRQTHRSLEDKKAKKCPFCSKIYVSMPAFSMHLRTHNQTCKCTICDKCFSRPWLLQGHIRTHTGERPFPCYLCTKAFADKSNLRAHIQTHSNAKPFACRKCGKTFALKSYLYKHEESACNGSSTTKIMVGQ